MMESACDLLTQISPNDITLLVFASISLHHTENVYLEAECFNNEEVQGCYSNIKARSHHKQAS